MEKEHKDVLEDYFNEVEQELGVLNEYFIAEEEGLEISVEPNGETDRGWEKDPYFKAYKNNKSQVARIYINRAEYCKSHRGAEVFELNSKERKILVKILSANNYEKWKKLLKRTKDYIESNNFGKFSTNLKMSDYSKL